MSGLSTKDVKETTGGMAKVIMPGEHVVKINSVELQHMDWMKEDDAYYLTMHVETEPIDGFEGFFLDPDNEDKGRYLGQIGHVKTSRWYYKDSVTKSGIEINRDAELLKAFKSICRAAGALEWFDSVDGKFNTVEEFVEGMNSSGIFKDAWIRMCVGGREYQKQNSEYTGWDLFLPKPVGKVVGMEPKDVEKSELMAFSEDHVEKLEPSSEESFGGDETSEEVEDDFEV